MEFQEAIYTANEDELSADVCVELLGSIEVNITVVLSTDELSALPENMRANCKKVLLRNLSP